MIGNQTIYEQSESSHRIRPFGILGDLFFGIVETFSDSTGQNRSNDINESRSLKPKPVFSPPDLMSSDTDGVWVAGQQIVMAYRRYNRPIVCDTPYFFKDKAVSARTKIPAPVPTAQEPFNGQGFCGKLAHLRKPDPLKKKETKPFSLQDAA
jgi:type IV secretory pathway TraG/TraD family ATPase VirD4